MEGIKNIPIVLANIEWMPPEKLLKEVSNERMINGLCDLIKPEFAKKSVGDAECLAYLIPQTGKASLPSNWVEIYLYLAGRVLKRWKQYDALPNDCKVEKLDDYQEKRLKELRMWIYEKRGGKYQNPILSAIKEVFII